ncbi:MAG: hypothetical protein JWQ72_550 [Polaromonas sp.]|nr:hypothetical protein [Polaromonas sp.]
MLVDHKRLSDTDPVGPFKPPHGVPGYSTGHTQLPKKAYSLLQCSIFACDRNRCPVTRQKSFSQTLLKATQMTGMGRLMDATKLIQRALLGPVTSAKAPVRRPPAHAPRREGGYAGTAPVVEDAVIVTPGVTPNEAAPRTSRPAAFTPHSFTFDGEKYPYRLYIPPTAANEAPVVAGMPLIVLLHGCKQDAGDFARGTAMNDLAATQGCMVLYPEQISKANGGRCWNWFEPGHQQAGRGEPGMIAALTAKVLAAHPGADPQRVYIAGLSAGGAMAAVVAGLYPEMFAAVGIHSGLASGAAQDLMSAFGAMRHGAKGQAVTALPTIVFHGSADKTVHPDNGDHISDAAAAALKASGLALTKSRTKVDTGGPVTEKVVYRTPDGPSYVEHWRIDAGPHAWSGGSPDGSFTDPDGPSASAAMLAFFLQHRKA